MFAAEMDGAFRLSFDSGDAASPAPAVEIVRINLRRDIAPSSASALRLPEWLLPTQRGEGAWQEECVP